MAVMDVMSTRLVLHPIDPAEARSIIDGTGRTGGSWHPDYPLADELDPLRGLADSAPRESVFTLYQLRLRESGLAIGGIGFFGPPDADGSVEIGYGLVEGERGRGFATEALRSLVNVVVDNGALRVIADTEVGNRASQAVLRKSRFSETHRSETVVYYARDLAR